MRDEVTIDNATIRPTYPDGDAHFGLELGTNGTAAATRRACVERPGLRWVRHDGRHATGLLLTPTGKDDAVNPWDGRP